MNTYEGYNSSVSIALTVYFQNKEKALRAYEREEKSIQIEGEVA